MIIPFLVADIAPAVLGKLVHLEKLDLRFNALKVGGKFEFGSPQAGVLLTMVSITARR